MIDWVKAVRAEELRKHAGDPGPVLARRLSNSEYNYTIRDLTGVDLKPTGNSRSIRPIRPDSTTAANR